MGKTYPPATKCANGFASGFSWLAGGVRFGMTSPISLDCGIKSLFTDGGVLPSCAGAELGAAVVEKVIVGRK